VRTIKMPIPKNRSLLVLLAFCFVCAWAPEVHGQISITTASPLPDGVAGVNYPQTQLLATGGTTGVRNWTIVSGSLPAGLSLSAAGLISGMPSTPGNSNFRVRVTSNSVFAEKNFDLTISTPVTISTASPLPSGTQGTPYPQQTFAATGGMTPYSWSIASGSLPPGLSLSGGDNRNLGGTPTLAGTYNFTIRVTDDSSPQQIATKPMTLVIAGPLTITNSSPLPPAAVGVPYPEVLNATGGTPPYTWALASGSLPAGLFLSSAGVFSGTPTATGTSNFTVRVTDGNSISVQKAFTLVVGTAVTITTSSPLTTALLGVSYVQTLSATGGTTPYTWSVFSGSLPPGLTLTGATITGTPTTAGTFNFTIRVTDSSTPAKTFDRAFTLDVVLPLMIATAATLPSGMPGVAYSQSLSAAGGLSPYSWSIISGALPAGLSMSPAGVITGTPTTPGSSNFTVRVLDSSTPPQNFQRTFSISIASALSIVTASPLPPGAAGVPYSQAFAATGGTTPYSWSITAGALPPGLTLSGATIAGTPTTTGISNFTVRVIDSSSPQLSASKAFTITVGSVLTITTVSLPPAATGSPYSAQLEASVGPPLTWSLASGTLPPGINLSSTGLLSGTPTMSGTFDFNVRVASGSPTQDSTRNFQIVVSSTVTLTTTTLPPATRFVPYSTTLIASGGVTPYTWSVISGSLPAGLSLSTAGVISGTPSTLGTSNFTVGVADSGGGSASRAFSLSVAAGALSITTPSLPGGVQGFTFSFQFEASGGPPPYTWSLVSGNLPAGFTLSAVGILQGNATAVSSGTIRVRVTDSSGATDQRDFSLAIGPPLGTVSLTGLAVRTAPVQQMPLTLSLPGPYPAELQGTLNLAFTSTAVVPIDDPAVQFSTGGRTVKFTIPANTTTAVFPSSLLLVTGTVAGTVAITGSIQNGPPVLSLTSTTVDTTAPQMTTLTANRVTGGLRVRIIGFSPERRVTDADFSFEVRVNSAIERVNLTRPVGADFNAWYQNPASAPFGSAFLFEQLFGVAGDTSAIEAVTITLRNAQGTTTSARVVFTAN
jgi:hypothetical protein